MYAQLPYDHGHSNALNICKTQTSYETSERRCQQIRLFCCLLLLNLYVIIKYSAALNFCRRICILNEWLIICCLATHVKCFLNIQE